MTIENASILVIRYENISENQSKFIHLEPWKVNSIFNQTPIDFTLTCFTSNSQSENKSFQRYYLT